MLKKIIFNNIHRKKIEYKNENKAPENLNILMILFSRKNLLLIFKPMIYSATASIKDNNNNIGMINNKVNPISYDLFTDLI